ncbi:hypothetical protein SMACR_09157 [Sordaria macrospora]|uniref:Uncharacterized protein n=1 Tax=Sordaria macrospora TaxID=5147 RepID=A0A8S8ZAV6_SORMA|nr:hypothetical protein SMACR_09157 [Sordaria macrospora]
MTIALDGNLFKAPITEDPKNALDLGTGTDDGTVEKDMAMGQWGKIWQEAGRRLGTPLDVFDQNIQEEGLKEAGFVNISKKTYPVPLSPWPKDKKLRDVGLYFYAVLNQDLEGATQFIFGNVLSWTKEEISSYCSHCYDPIRESYVGYTRWPIR